MIISLTPQILWGKETFQTTIVYLDVYRAYSDFFQRLMTVTDNAAHCKTIRFKENTQNGFDGTTCKF